MSSAPSSESGVTHTFRSWNLRSRVKRLVERLASYPTIVGTLKRLHGSRVTILAYHNILPDSEEVKGELPLHLPMRRFQSHLDTIESHFDVCSLKEVLGHNPANHTRRPRLAITFDDAYAGTLTLAVPELVRRGHPATVFAPSGLIGSQGFWWDAFDFLPSERNEICLTRLMGVTENVEAWAREHGRAPKPPGPSQRPGTADELITAANMPGIEIGVHTATHPNLVELSKDKVNLELELCRQDLEAWGIKVSPYVAYPYGLSTPLVRDTVRDGGWVAGLAIEGGRFRRENGNPWQLPRVSIPSQASAENVLLRVLGVIPT